MKQIFSLFTVLAMTMGTANSSFAQQETFRVVAILEAIRQANAGLFPAADPNVVKKHIPDGGAPMSTSAFVLFAGEDTVLFDTTTGSPAWDKNLTDAGVKPENVKLILLTHMHGDHIGGLLQGDVRRFPNAKVLCSEPEFGATQLAKVKSVYGQDFTAFKFDDEVFANAHAKVKALDAVGHTPGHTAFLVESVKNSTDKILIIGDLLHVAAVQFPVPEICASYDMDKEKSVASRKRILDFAAKEKIPVAGMHLPVPSIGTVKKTDGGYEWEPKKP
jgi:glyoxylase-like metal-dependent hydrolase (beta-lactamase superfamily II)